jgi:hypothetical protein
MAGLAGIYLETQVPGTIVPGTIGAVCLVLVGISLQIIPFDWIGLLLVLGGVALTIAEIHAGGTGLLLLPGLLLLGAGAFLVFRVPGVSDVSLPFWRFVAPMVAFVGLLGALMIWGVARSFGRPQRTGTASLIGAHGVADLGEAQKLLTPLLGSTAAATAFGIALLCCGLNSTVTATLSGQIVMEGFINVRLPAWARRLATRALAIIPAAIAIALYGVSGTGKLLIMSQVILSMQLPFAIVPLVMFTADRRKMGKLVAPRWVTALAVLVAVVVIALNAKIIVDLLVA